jgi:hypothetical protein
MTKHIKPRVPLARIRAALPEPTSFYISGRTIRDGITGRVIGVAK